MFFSEQFKGAHAASELPSSFRADLNFWLWMRIVYTDLEHNVSAQLIINGQS